MPRKLRRLALKGVSKMSKAAEAACVKFSRAYNQPRRVGAGLTALRPAS